MYKAIAIRSEPKGAVYHKLLEFAGQHCETFSLEWTEGRDLDWYEDIPPITRAPINASLEPFLVRQRHISQFRGIEISRAVYRLTKECLSLLRQAESLYLWQTRGWPTDLTLYVQGGEPWLVSQSDKRRSYIDTAAIPVDLIRAQIPELDLVLAKPTVTIDGQNFSAFSKEVGVPRNCDTT